MSSFAQYPFYGQPLYSVTGDQVRASIRSSNGLFILRRSSPFGNRLFSITKTGDITDLGDMNETEGGDVFSEGTLHTDGLVYLISRAENSAAVFDTATNTRTMVWPSTWWGGTNFVGALASDPLTDKLYIAKPGDGIYEVSTYANSNTLDVIGSKLLSLDSTYDQYNVSMWFFGNYFILSRDGSTDVQIFNKSDFSLVATTSKTVGDFQIFNSSDWYYLRINGDYIELHKRDINNLASDVLVISVPMPYSTGSTSIFGATISGNDIIFTLYGISSTPIITIDLGGGEPTTSLRIYVPVNNKTEWKKVNEVWVVVDGVWKKANSVYVPESGVWKNTVG